MNIIIYYIFVLYICTYIYYINYYIYIYIYSIIKCNSCGFNILIGIEWTNNDNTTHIHIYIYIYDTENIT